MVDPSYVEKHTLNVRMLRVVQDPASSVYTGPGTNHCGFNCAFNVAKTVKLTHATWMDFGRVASSVGYLQRVSDAVSLTWEYITW